MNELIKPNDIFVAVTQNPNLTLIDVALNLLTGDNTSFFTKDLYKSTPYVKNKYTENGVFNEYAFNQDFAKASLLYKAMTDRTAQQKFILSEMFYDPKSLNAPAGAKRNTPVVFYSKIHNPTLQAIGIELINVISDAEKTPEELALGNKIFDPKTQKFLDYTPETLGIWNKFLGRSLKYAKWESDGTHTDLRTGETKYHQAGDWKLDENGQFYTEIMYAEDKGMADVVKIADIITKEDSLLNKGDFFDSDGYTKSTIGTISKTVALTLPYFIPGVNKIYTGIMATAGTVSSLAAFARAIDALCTGENDWRWTNETTNWFEKFENSKSYEGRKGFFNVENFGELISTTFGQLHQQKMLGELGNILAGSKGVPTNMGRQFALGYMALTSSADVYNEAKLAGYSDRVAGLTGLLSGAALMGIMNLNESTRGIGTWFMNEEKEGAKIGLHSFSNLLFKDKSILPGVNKVVNAFDAQDIPKLKSAWNSVKDSFAKFGIRLNGAGPGLWSNALIEGLEEVTEEAALDFVKGAIDTMHYFGLVDNDTEGFGGFSNVFSKDGISRYLSTFAGGAFGGALFEAHNKWIEPLTNKDLAEYRNHLEERDIIDLLVDEDFSTIESYVRKLTPYFNRHVSAQIAVDDEGKPITLSVENGKSQADIIVEGILNRLSTIKKAIDLELQNSFGDNLLLKNSLFLKRTPGNKHLYTSIKQRILDSYHNKYIQSEYVDAIQEIVDIKSTINSLSDDLNEERKKETDKLKLAVEKLDKFFNTENIYKYHAHYSFFANDKLKEGIGKVSEHNHLDISSYCHFKYHKDYDKLPSREDGATGLTKEQVKEEWDIYTSSLSLKEFNKKLAVLFDLYKDSIETFSNHLSNGLLNYLFDERVTNKETPFTSLEEKILQILKDKKGELKEEDIENILDSFAQEYYKFTTNNPAIINFKTPKFLNFYTVLDNLGCFEFKFSDKIPVELHDKLKEAISPIIQSTISHYMSLFGGPNFIWNKDLFKLLFDNHIKLYIENPLKTHNIFSYELSDILKKFVEDNGLDKEVMDHPILINLVSRVLNNPETFNLLNNWQIAETVEGSKYFTDAAYLNEDEKYTIPSLYLRSLENYIITKTQSILENTYYTKLKGIVDDSRKSEYTQLYEKVLRIIKEYPHTLLKTLERLPTHLEEGEFVNVTFEGDLNAQDIVSFINFNLYADPTPSQTISELSPYITYAVLYSKKYSYPINEGSFLDLIDAFFRKFIYDNLDLSAYDYLYKKEFELSSLSSLDFALFSKEEVDTIIQLLLSTIDHLLTIVYGMSKEANINHELAEYYDYVNKKSDGSDKYMTLSDDTYKALTRKLLEFKSRIDKLDRLLKNKSESKIKQEKETAKKIHSVLIDQYKAGIEIGGEVILPAQLYDANTDDEEFILKCEVAIHLYFQLKTQEEKNKIIELYIKDKENSDIYINEYSTLDIYENGFVHPNFMLQKLLLLMIYNPAQLEMDYITAIKNNDLIFKLDQQFAFNTAICYFYDKESKDLFNHAYSKLYEIYKNKSGDDKLKYLDYLKHCIYILGKSGSGKSSAVGYALVQHWKKNNFKIHAAAPTLFKAEELIKNFKLEDSDKKTILGDDSIFKDILTPEGYSGLVALSEELELKLQEVNTIEDIKKAVGKTIFKKDIPLSQGVTATLSFKYEDKASQFLKIEFTGLETYLSDKINIKNDNEKHVIIIDEATLLNPILLQAFSIIANQHSNINIQFLGDDKQPGFTFGWRSIYEPTGTKEFFAKESINIIKNYLIEALYLNALFRTNNSAQTHNINILYDIASEFNDKFNHVIIGDGTKLDYVDKNKDILYFQYNDDKLLGTKIVTENSLFLSDLNKFKDKISKDNLLYLVCDENNELELKDLLANLGFTEDTYKIFIHDSFDLSRNILGSESDYVVLYKLKEGGKADVSADSKLAYLNGSRAKEYTLIYEDSKDGLYTSFGFTSIFTKDVYSELVDVDRIRTYTKEIISRKEKLLAPYLKVKPTSVPQQPVQSAQEDSAELPVAALLNLTNIEPEVNVEPKKEGEELNNENEADESGKKVNVLSDDAKKEQAEVGALPEDVIDDSFKSLDSALKSFIADDSYRAINEDYYTYLGPNIKFILNNSGQYVLSEESKEYILKNYNSDTDNEFLIWLKNINLWEQVFDLDNDYVLANVFKDIKLLINNRNITSELTKEDNDFIIKAANLYAAFRHHLALGYDNLSSQAKESKDVLFSIIKINNPQCFNKFSDIFFNNAKSNASLFTRFEITINGTNLICTLGQVHGDEFNASNRENTELVGPKGVYKTMKLFKEGRRRKEKELLHKINLLRNDSGADLPELTADDVSQFGFFIYKNNRPYSITNKTFKDKEGNNIPAGAAGLNRFISLSDAEKYYNYTIEEVYYFNGNLDAFLEMHSRIMGFPITNIDKLEKPIKNNMWAKIRLNTGELKLMLLDKRLKDGLAIPVLDLEESNLHNLINAPFLHYYNSTLETLIRLKFPNISIDNGIVSKIFPHTNTKSESIAGKVDTEFKNAYLDLVEEILQKINTDDSLSEEMKKSLISFYLHTVDAFNFDRSNADKLKLGSFETDNLTKAVSRGKIHSLSLPLFKKHILPTLSEDIIGALNKLNPKLLIFPILKDYDEDLLYFDTLDGIYVSDLAYKLLDNLYLTSIYEGPRCLLDLNLFRESEYKLTDSNLPEKLNQIKEVNDLYNIWSNDVIFKDSTLDALVNDFWELAKNKGIYRLSLVSKELDILDNTEIEFVKEGKLTVYVYEVTKGFKISSPIRLYNEVSDKKIIYIDDRTMPTNTALKIQSTNATHSIEELKLYISKCSVFIDQIKVIIKSISEDTKFESIEEVVNYINKNLSIVTIDELFINANNLDLSKYIRELVLLEIVLESNELQDIIKQIMNIEPNFKNITLLQYLINHAELGQLITLYMNLRGFKKNQIRQAINEMKAKC